MKKILAIMVLGVLMTVALCGCASLPKGVDEVKELYIMDDLYKTAAVRVCGAEPAVNKAIKKLFIESLTIGALFGNVVDYNGSSKEADFWIDVVIDEMGKSKNNYTYNGIPAGYTTGGYSSFTVKFYDPKQKLLVGKIDVSRSGGNQLTNFSGDRYKSGFEKVIDDIVEYIRMKQDKFTKK